MSNKYKHANEVPAIVLAKRLHELANYVAEGTDKILKEFVMRVPAELDRCPDVMLAISANRLIEMESKIILLNMRIEKLISEKIN